MSNDDDEDYTEKPQKVSPTKRKRKPPPPPPPPAAIKVNHDLSENSDDDLPYSRRSITIKPKRRQATPSSSSISSDNSRSSKRTRPPIPTFKRKQGKKNKKNLDETSDDDIVITDEDYNTDVEKMDDNTLIKKTERRMLNDADLTQMTKKALEDEKQRVQRVQERQSQLPPSSQIIIDDDNFSFENNTQKKDGENEAQLVFEFEPNTNKPWIAVLPELVAKMKPHQLDGTMFLWDNVYESVAQIKKDNTGTGCILAHHMGL
jgi:hypothetical protein